MPEEDVIDTVARCVAVLSSAVMAAAAGERDYTKVLATSDIYLDFIRPRRLHVNKEGEVSFSPED